MDLEQLKKDTKEILVDVLEKSRLRQGQILVLGMSSSEVAGGRIGKASNIDIAEAIVQTLLDELNPRGIYLAVLEDGNARLTLADGATYTAEKGLIAAGRMPNTEHLDAENAGCALNRRGFITTDYYLQSSPNSWAIGDVNGKMLFAHAASHQGEYVARTILGLEFSPYQAGPCPYCLHGSMEIMHVGLTEREAAALGGEILVSKSLFSSNVISQARGDASGFVKVVWRNGEMAGIAAIGGCATQLTLSAELLLMGQYSGSRLNSFMVAHPTLDETLVDAVKAPRRPSEY